MTDERYDQFEAYLRGTLDEDQRRTLLAALQEPDVQAELRAYREIRQQIGQRHQRQAKTDAFTAQLQRLGKQYGASSRTAGRRLPLRRLMLWAASFVLVAGVSLLTLKKYQFSDQQLIAHHLAEFPEHTERGTTSLNRFYKARIAYQNEDWAIAAAAFDRVPASDESFVEAQLMAGYAYLQNRDYQQAQEAFRTVIAQADAAQRQNAEWHLALSQIPAVTDRQVPTVLQAILTDRDHAFYEEAQSLVEDLRSIWR